MIMVSIIMPAYNAEKTINEAIESVLQQTYTNFELIVINDCSKDLTKDIILRYCNADHRVKIICNSMNLGVSKSRNIGIACAKGKYIAFLDSDDMWRKDKLEKQITLMESNVSILSYTASSFIDEVGNPYDYIMEAEEKTTLNTLLKKNIISCSSAMILADIMKELKMPSDKMHEDYYIWITVLKKYEYAYGINEPLLIYRLASNSKSSNRLKSAKMIYNTYCAVGYNYFTSFILMLRYSIYSISKRYKIKHYSLKKA